MHPLPILFFCLLCSVCHSHSMHLLFPIHFSYCTTPLLLHTCITSPQQQQPHHFFVLCSYSFYAPCACNMHNDSASLHSECSVWSSLWLLSFSGSFPTHSTSLDVMLRFLSLSGSRDSSSSLAQLSLYFLLQLQTSMLIHLSVPLRIVFIHWKKLGEPSTPLAIT